MTPPGPAPLVQCEDVAWFRDQTGGARGAAAALGRRVGLGEERTAQLVLAVAELVTNADKYAVDGSLLLRVLRQGDVAGVEVLAVDGGPGMADVSAVLRDGMSTGGSLGIGLGAVKRLADRFDIHSRPGTGTVVLARFWPRPTPPSAAGECPVAGITRPIGGEEVCGDAWAARADTLDGEDPPDEAGGLAGRPAEGAQGVGRSGLFRPPDAGPGGGLLVMSCDGLGHGPLASLAAQAAVQAFHTSTARTPQQAVEDIHKALHGTRGAALAVARIEPDGRTLFCGVGNITAALVTATTRTNLLSHPGIVGHQMHQLRSYEYRLPPHGVLVMHSDGLSHRWTPDDLAGLLHHTPAVIAAGLLRQAGTRRDDAGAVVAKASR
ncbi:ATP-binding SpoIIE family protein phosphatase [Actinacidiphila paucisporea]|uniref:Anti-sigma regulatory factor (Ser/Thr protein kinase) n=1 Tax=Actinacidiphila paucisporea TaxID=310782 RepID=A0A1M7I793_9ACTN|nr:ATP-binding SpoIIE family protein phosphatase [Actinacidiphila paucisporea]SHM36661.1 Anti-sigma regulatory factor (Ser/Thr protein kinase) [Actinacidiphila paucisporea]